MTAEQRAERTRAADGLCARAWDDCDGGDHGVALVAVGGYGRAELAPYSDLDLVLVHDDGVEVGELASQLWYPFWDSGVALDHSVRSLTQMVEQADADPRVASGLLDVRHVAGDPHLALRLRTTVLAAWRRGARERLPRIKDQTETRHRLVGELCHLSVPDVKEAEGGLRDATTLRGLVATWLVDVPPELEFARQQLLDVRDVVQELAGRASDRIVPEMWADLAERLELPGERAAQKHVRTIGRRITHLSRLAWRRADAVVARPAGVRPRRPQLERVAPGVAVSGGEVVLERTANPSADPLLLLRAAAAAAERGLLLAPATASRLGSEAAALPDPWPEEARQLMVRLLASGPGLLDVWDTLDETGALEHLLPEWERVRLLPHASVIHRFTVDRHVIETCIEASSLIRTVARPDVLLVASLLHDIGKGGLVEHSVAGAPVAREVARRWGFDPGCVDLIHDLVRWHLLLAETATTRDPSDPATVAVVTERIHDAEALSLLAALTEADAKATSTKAWTSWRAGLVHDLVRRSSRVLDTGVAPPPITTDDVAIPGGLAPGAVWLGVEKVDDGTRVTAIGHDRVGLLADLAAMFGLRRVHLHAARAWAQGEYGVSVWDVDDAGLDTAVLRMTFERVVRGDVDPASRFTDAWPDRLEPSVVVRPEASEEATVLEVRATDRPGVVHLVCAALARLDLTVRSAHVDTLGPQAVDVFYVQEAHAAALADSRAAEAAHAVRAALGA